jgi:hypothetical protein
MAARRGLTGWIPVVGWIMTAVDVAATGYEVYSSASAIADEIKDLKNLVDEIKKQADKITQTFKKYENDLKGFGGLSEERKKEVAREVMADVQGAYGAANPCMRARKCLLVPYNKADSANGWAGNGCCPGQTGHHLMPDAMFRSRDKAIQDKALSQWKSTYGGEKPKESLTYNDMPRDKKPTTKCWDNYAEGPAPTICLEGSDNTSGSHGVVHAATETIITPFRAKPEMDYNTATKLLAKEISIAYGCNPNCLEAQLDEYYCKAYSCGEKSQSCEERLKDAKVIPHSGMPNGGPRTSGGTHNGGMGG